MTRAIEIWRRSPATCVAAVIAFVTILRIAIVILTPFQLGPDEAQYWRWSRTLDWGYYSKPPLIAWVIWATTAVFGDTEWAVRLSSPILHGLAAFGLFALARAVMSPRDAGARDAGAIAGAWTAAIYMAMPGVALSSVIMSTDAVLLAFWSLGLLALWRMRDRPTLVSGLLFGLALGLAMLAKYAASYLLVGAVIAAMIDPPTRRAFLSPAGLAALAGFALAFGPNVFWNATHKFATLSHTADNADWEEAAFDASRAFNFLADQLGVFGPLTLIVLFLGGGIALARLPRLFKSASDLKLTRDLWLVCFVLPPLAVIVVQAMISRAHANWAATAYPAACVLLGVWVAEGRWRRLIFGGVALNAAVVLFFSVVAVAPSIGDAAGASNSLKRVRGWRELAQTVNTIAAEQKATALYFDEREYWHGVDYYGRNLPGLPPVRQWTHAAEPRSFAEEAGRLQPGEDSRVLIVSQRDDFRPKIRGDFKSMVRLHVISIPIDRKPSHNREALLYIASGYSQAPRDPDFDKRHQGMSEE